MRQFAIVWLPGQSSCKEALGCVVAPPPPAAQHTTPPHNLSPSSRGIFGTALHLLSWQQNKHGGRVGLFQNLKTGCLSSGFDSVSPPRGERNKLVCVAIVALFIAGRKREKKNNKPRGFNSIQECGHCTTSDQTGEPDAPQPCSL